MHEHRLTFNMLAVIFGARINHLPMTILWMEIVTNTDKRTIWKPFYSKNGNKNSCEKLHPKDSKIYEQVVGKQRKHEDFFDERHKTIDFIIKRKVWLKVTQLRRKKL